jgi:hypothetical protein
MANFSETQKTKIRGYLGYTQSNALGSLTIQEQNLNDYLGRDFDTSYITEIQTILTSLDTVNTNITTLLASANIIQADVVKFDNTSGVSNLNERGAKLVRKLASLVGVKVLFNEFKNSTSVSTFVGY